MRSIAFATLIVVSLCVLGAGMESAEARGERGIDLQAFMTGLACTESGGRFDALNDRTGALGKYQIMPGNWRAWANRYMGNKWAAPTARNQEFVARQRIQALYDKHGSWRTVAQWWLTGNAHRDEALWSPGTTRYVNKVMGTARESVTPSVLETVKERCFPVAYRDPRVRTEPWPRARVTGRRVTIRASAGSEFRILDFVRRDARLVVIGEANDPRGKPWLRIGLAKGRVGWVAAWFTEPIGQ